MGKRLAPFEWLRDNSDDLNPRPWTLDPERFGSCLPDKVYDKVNLASLYVGKWIDKDGTIRDGPDGQVQLGKTGGYLDPNKYKFTPGLQLQGSEIRRVVQDNTCPTGQTHISKNPLATCDWM